MGYMSMFKPRKKQKSSLWDDDDDWNDDEREEEEEPPKPAFPLSAVPSVAVAVSVSLGINFIVLGIFGLIAYVVTNGTSMLHRLILIVSILVLVTGCISFPIGVSKYRYLARFFRYIGWIERRTVVSIDDLARKAETDADAVRKDFHKAYVDELLPEAHLSDDMTILYLTNASFEAKEAPIPIP